jgi:hypothetical protein
VRLPPSCEPNVELQGRLFGFDGGHRKLPDKPGSLWDALVSFDVEVLNRTPHREELLAVRGADVEAVLLLADDAGRLADAFAWCVAIPGPGTAPAIRLSIPARRSRTAWSAEIGNLAAVAAWADWHPSEDLDQLPRGKNVSASLAAAAARGAGSGVRILDVHATGGGVRSETPTGKTVAPHLRRGHWRRKHYGPRNILVRRVRIGPVLVNAGGGELLPQIYRLPT